MQTDIYSARNQMGQWTGSLGVSILQNLPQGFSQSQSPVLSPEFLYAEADTSLVTPQIVRNYQDQVEISQNSDDLDSLSSSDFVSGYDSNGQYT